MVTNFVFLIGFEWTCDTAGEYLQNIYVT